MPTLLSLGLANALVAAVLMGTAASDIFTQDLEDFVEPESAAGGTPKASSRATSEAPPDEKGELRNKLYKLAESAGVLVDDGADSRVILAEEDKKNIKGGTELDEMRIADMPVGVIKYLIKKMTERQELMKQ